MVCNPGLQVFFGILLTSDAEKLAVNDTILIDTNSDLAFEEFAWHPEAHQIGRTSWSIS